jgi:hypothetical protein
VAEDTRVDNDARAAIDAHDVRDARHVLDSHDVCVDNDTLAASKQQFTPSPSHKKDPVPRSGDGVLLAT